MEELLKTPSKRYELRSFLDVLAGHRRETGGQTFLIHLFCSMSQIWVAAF